MVGTGLAWKLVQRPLTSSGRACGICEILFACGLKRSSTHSRQGPDTIFVIIEQKAKLINETTV